MRPHVDRQDLLLRLEAGSAEVLVGELGSVDLGRGRVLDRSGDAALG